MKPTSEVRCPYLRSGRFSYLRTGPSRSGLHEEGVAVDFGGCIAPNPSTMALSLVCWEGQLNLDNGRQLSVFELYPSNGDGPTHLLKPNETLVSISIESTQPDERSAWIRFSHRVHAEWPSVEAVVRLVIEEDRIARSYIVLGGLPCLL